MKENTKLKDDFSQQTQELQQKMDELEQVLSQKLCNILLQQEQTMRRKLKPSL